MSNDPSASAEPLADLPTLDRDGDVFVLNLGSGENRFNPDRNAALRDLLQKVLTTSGPRALVTAATGKFWSNGLDLDWLGQHPDQIQATIDGLHELLADFLGAAIPTVAAVQGHAFAAGAMFSVTHDHVVMRADRGFWCLPEVDLRMPFTPGMNALLAGRLPVGAANEAMLTGRRYTAPEALAAGIVHQVAAEDEVLAKAVEHAGALTEKDATTLGTIKQRLHAATLAALRAPQPI